VELEGGIGAGPCGYGLDGWWVLMGEEMRVLVVERVDPVHYMWESGQEKVGKE
jgi:hypothetical protein